jgi:hypothetical protein
MRLYLIISIISFSILSCSSSTKKKWFDDNSVSMMSEERSASEQNHKEETSSIPKFDMGKTLGVLSLSSEVGMNVDDTIKLLNEDGSVWFKFTFYYNDSDGKYDYYKEDFSPFAFHPDYSLLGLVVIADEGDRYKVIVNEEKGLEKYIKKKSYLEFFEWGGFIETKVFSVEFDQENNPLRKSNNSTSSILPYSKDEFYHPNKVEGDWLQVKWGYEDNWEYGWIKWRDGNYIIVRWYYFA